MSHNADLIQSILAIVQKDYPADQFRFVTEKAIPGTRMRPDILVCDLEDRLRCVVEIGYTRPEKLTSYRDKLKIPDVRWYDKQGNLHADVKERVVRVSIEMQPSGLFAVYRICDWVQCRAEGCESEAEIYSEIVLGRGWTKPLSWQEELDILDEISERRAAETWLLAITDYARVWFACFCDKCGEVWTPSEEDDLELYAVAEDFRSVSTRDFAKHWGKRQVQGEWNEASAFVRNYLGVELQYEDGDFLTTDQKQGFNRALSAIRLESQVGQFPIGANGQA